MIISELLNRDNDEEKAGGHISQVIFNDGTTLNIKKNSIVIFVGPNNVGKSQALRDIYELCDVKKPSIVVKDIKIVHSKVPYKTMMPNITKATNRGDDMEYDGFNIHVNSMSIIGNLEKEYSYFALRNAFVAFLDTEKRLNITEPPRSIEAFAVKDHPIHYAAFDTKYRKWLSDNYKMAFKEPITPDICFGATVPLCIGEVDYQYNQSLNIITNIEKYASKLNALPKVHEQGDGIRSFVGILLYLMMDYYRTFLIDEPEAFLHAPQTKIMGEIIGKTLTNNQQAFISTHSVNIIKGLLDICPDRVTVVRITRDRSNNFAILDNDKIKEVWKDSLLRHSNILDGLFYKNVVLCESDSDCKMYSIIDEYIKNSQKCFSETLFTYCGGKSRMASASIILKALKVDVKLIPDLDFINNEKEFRKIVEACGINWIEVEKDYKIVLAALKNENLCKRLKSVGEDLIPSGTVSQAFKQLKNILNSYGIFPVPVGELERFCADVGEHGQNWVNGVLEKHPDLGDTVYKDIIDFISSIKL